MAAYGEIAAECHVEAVKYRMQGIFEVFARHAFLLAGVLLIEMGLNGHHFIALVHAECAGPRMVGAGHIYLLEAHSDACHYGGYEHVAGARHGQARFEKHVLERGPSLGSYGVVGLHGDVGIRLYVGRNPACRGTRYEQAHLPCHVLCKRLCEPCHVGVGCIVEEMRVGEDVEVGPEFGEFRRVCSEIHCHRGQ